MDGKIISPPKKCMNTARMALVVSSQSQLQTADFKMHAMVKSSPVLIISQVMNKVNLGRVSGQCFYLLLLFSFCARLPEWCSSLDVAPNDNTVQSCIEDCEYLLFDQN